MKIPPKTPEELKELAQGIFAGTIFTDRHLKSPDLMVMVWLPIALGALSDWTEAEVKEIGMIYEHLEKAGPRAINGCPSFMSVRFLNTGDAKKVMEAVRYLSKQKDPELERIVGG